VFCFFSRTFSLQKFARTAPLLGGLRRKVFAGVSSMLWAQKLEIPELALQVELSGYHYLDCSWGIAAS